MQAVQLGFSPRMRIYHTSRTEYTQIYIPAVNWALLIGCILIVFAFHSSTTSLRSASARARRLAHAAEHLAHYRLSCERERRRHVVFSQP